MHDLPEQLQLRLAQEILKERTTVTVQLHLPYELGNLLR